MVEASEGPGVGLARLNVYWRDSSFRAALSDLMSLTPPEITRLQEMTSRSLELPSSAADEFRMDRARFGRAMAALRALYRIISTDDAPAQSVLAQIRKLASASG